MTEAWIIDACRTPRGIGKIGKGALADIHPQQLGATVLKALAERTGINTAEVDDVIWGTSSQRGAQGGDLGRMSALDAGYDIHSSGVTLDRFCGSGITTVNMAAAAIMSGMEDLVVAGGTEMMSMAGRRTSDEGAADDGQRQSAPARLASAIEPGGLRRRHRQPRGDHPRGGRRPGPGQPAARRPRHRPRPLRKKPGARLQGRRQPRPRPRGVSPPADHPRGPRQPEARLRGLGRRATGRPGRHLSQPDPAEISRAGHQVSSTTPAILQGWWTARARSCWRRRPTPRRTV